MNTYAEPKTEAVLRPWHSVTVGTTSLRLIKLTPREMGFEEPAPGYRLTDQTFIREWSDQNRDKLDGGAIDLLPNSFADDFAERRIPETGDDVPHWFAEFGYILGLIWSDGGEDYEWIRRSIEDLWELDDIIVYRLISR